MGGEISTAEPIVLTRNPISYSQYWKIVSLYDSSPTLLD